MNFLAIWKGTIKGENIANRCAAKAIERLILISNDAEVFRFAAGGKQGQNLFLDKVSILVFIHENVADRVRHPLEDVRPGQ